MVSLQDDVNQIHIGHDDSTHAIDYVLDSVGCKYDFVYADGNLTAIVCKDSTGNAITSNGTSSSIQYTISGGNLVSVTYANGDFVTYTYDANCRITSMSNVDKCGYAFAYNGNSVVDTVTAKAAMGMHAEESGVDTYYEQPENNAAVITSEDTQQRYTFDGCGRTLSCELLMATTEAAAQGVDDGAFECIYGMTLRPSGSRCHPVRECTAPAPYSVRIEMRSALMCCPFAEVQGNLAGDLGKKRKQIGPGLMWRSRPPYFSAVWDIASWSRLRNKSTIWWSSKAFISFPSYLMPSTNKLDWRVQVSFFKIIA